MYDCPLFNTHHAPVGAWASLTFGAPYYPRIVTAALWLEGFTA